MSDHQNEELWRTIFAEGHPSLRSFQRFHLRLPSPPRCRLCFAPFGGIGSLLMTLKGKAPSSRNPNFCSACDKFMAAFPGGAEVEMSMLFVDIRGSTPLSESMTPTEFNRTINSFFGVATKILNEHDGFIINLAGDAVVGLFPPGFSGPKHAHKAVGATRALLSTEMPGGAGTPLQIGVGAHTGVVYIGTLTGSPGGNQDVSATGANMNLTARLASAAQPGEGLLSEAVCHDAGVDLEALERRTLQLKGISSPTAAVVLRK